MADDPEKERRLGPRIDPSILARLHKSQQDAYETLTQRERQTLALIAEGNTNRKIAAALGLAVKTVDIHRMRLMRKLNAPDMATLMNFVSPRKVPVESLPGIFGSWRIIEVSGLEDALLDIRGEAFIRFESNGSGEFRFGHVNGVMTYKMGDPNTKKAVECLWEGHEGRDAASGKGWAAFGRAWTLIGEFSFKGGRRVTFKATKMEEAAVGVRPVRGRPNPHGSFTARERQIPPTDC